jgi:bidirectional [NiFe] hydrogenase diaphorase subunit
MSKITLKIDGKTVSANKEETILDAARSLGIEIPTLCHHKKLIPYGACRLCLVELKQGKRSQLVASCGYYVKEGLEIYTQSERVQKVRKLVLELLLSILRNSPEIKRLARQYDVLTTRYKKFIHYCILCGLCVRYCDEVKKKNYLGFVGRGVDREVAWIPLSNYEDTCKNCMECLLLCPTGVFPSNWGVANNTMQQ